MDINKIVSKVDHTLLKVDATWNDIKKLCDEAMEYKTASICIPPAYIKRAADYLNGNIPVCTVIGFPNGYNTKDSKVFETKNAIENGALEMDMVINIGDLKDKNYNKILDEINSIKKACGDKILKVIIETAILNKDEKIKMCEIISKSNADYIKTSTGFSTGGATFEDIILFKESIKENKKIKAAGGISSLDDAQKFIDLGADRLGTSSIVRLIKNS